MAAIGKVPGLKEIIAAQRAEGRTYSEISEELRLTHRSARGFSVRSIERFCEEHSIRRSGRLGKNDLNKIVAAAVTQVCSASISLTLFYKLNSRCTQQIIYLWSCNHNPLIIICKYNAP